MSPDFWGATRVAAFGTGVKFTSVGLGVGLSLFFLQVGAGAWSIGLIPGLMGVALLVAWAIESKTRDKAGPPR